MDRSILARYFACAAGADHEDDWIDSVLDRVECEIASGDWRGAKARCELFMLDIEAHFAFEELVISRTRFAAMQDHCRHHGEGLAVMRDLLERLPRHATQDNEHTRSTLIAALRDFRRHAHAHVECHDGSLWRHTSHLAGLAAAPGEH